jgi:hypothetical protein
MTMPRGGARAETGDVMSTLIRSLNPGVVWDIFPAVTKFSACKDYIIGRLWALGSAQLDPSGFLTLLRFFSK